MQESVDERLPGRGAVEQDAHAAIVPAALTRLRTLESFRSRLQADLPHIRVVGPIGVPVAFTIVKGDELYQLFVAAPARGSGVAVALLEDAEARLAARGVETAWLACAIVIILAWLVWSSIPTTATHSCMYRAT